MTLAAAPTWLAAAEPILVPIVEPAFNIFEVADPTVIKPADEFLVPFLMDRSAVTNGVMEVPQFEGGFVTPASTILQPTPFLEPRVAPPSEGDSRVATGDSAANATEGASTDSNQTRTGDQASTFGSKDLVRGSEAMPRSASDLGSLLKKSPSALSTGSQMRTPIVNDPRIRGSRIGSLAASGSHWVPARADLDTVLSKFDSRQIESVSIIPGPYTSRLGPGFAFTDIQLLQSPRYANGFESHGNTAADYRANGNQVLGQQGVMFGSSNWGGRFNYTYRDGNDYLDGSGQAIPSSYRSQEMLASLGRDWGKDSIEISVLRLDQTDVIFPGYVFDLDYLVTDGYDVTHTRREAGMWDFVETNVWYNRTRFNGNAQNPRKRAFFPVLDLLNYYGDY